MGMDFKINEYGEIIKEDDELTVLERKCLIGVPLNIEIRKRLAAESQNIHVLEICLKDRAITVRRTVWSNPYLTPELRMEATRQRLLDKKAASNANSPVKPAMKKPASAKLNKEQFKQYKVQQETKRIETFEKNSKNNIGDKGYLWFIIVASILGAFFTYLAGEM